PHSPAPKEAGEQAVRPRRVQRDKMPARPTDHRPSAPAANPIPTNAASRSPACALPAAPGYPGRWVRRAAARRDEKRSWTWLRLLTSDSRQGSLDMAHQVLHHESLVGADCHAHTALAQVIGDDRTHGRDLRSLQSPAQQVLLSALGRHFKE